MDNGAFLLVFLGVIGLVLVKVCIKSSKCETRRARLSINSTRQTINIWLLRFIIPESTRLKKLSVITKPKSLN